MLNTLNKVCTLQFNFTNQIPFFFSAGNFFNFPPIIFQFYLFKSYSIEQMQITFFLIDFNTQLYYYISIIHFIFHLFS